MSKHRVHFKISIEGFMELDLDEDDCPLHEFSSVGTYDLVNYLATALRLAEGLVQPHEIEDMHSECLDPPLVQLAREAE